MSENVTETLNWLTVAPDTLQYAFLIMTLMAVAVNVLSKSAAVSVAVIALAGGTIYFSATSDDPNNFIMIAGALLCIGGAIGAIRYGVQRAG